MFSGFRSLYLKIIVIPDVFCLGLDRFVHEGALRDQYSPVHNVKGVEVAEGAGDLSSIEPGSGLQEDPFPLEMIEELEGKKNKSVSSTATTKHWCCDLIWTVARLELTSPPFT